MSSTPRPAIAELVRLPMADGTRLAVHVHRPDTDQPVPAIVSYTPYRLGALGGPPAIVADGYATISFDIRGTGNSEGSNDSIYSPAEQADGVQVIEWAAAQSWCNGNVGIWGISFGGVVSLQMAGAAPPALKAVIVRAGSDDPYRWWTNPGGSPRPYLYLNYAAIMAAANFSPPDPAVVGSDWCRIWLERLAGNRPWGLSFAEQQLDGPFWRERSIRGHLDQVTAAVFVVDGWADWYPTPLLQVYAGLTGPKRALMGPWSHQWPDSGVPGPRVDWLLEARRWFDRWLKGREDPLPDEPPVRLFVREHTPPATLLLQDRGDFGATSAWPPPQMREETWHFGPEGSLSEAPSATDGADTVRYDPRVGVASGFHGGGPFNINWAMPLDQRADEPGSVVYSGPVLTDELLVIGQPRLRLHLRSSAPVAAVAAKLCDVAPDGSSALVTKGSLNLTHRASDTTPELLEPGQDYTVEVELLACAWRFRAGHRVRLLLAGGDLLNLWPTPYHAELTIERSVARPSALVLPVVPASALAPVTLPPSPLPPARREELSAPELRITQDLIRDETTVEYQVAYGPHWTNTARYTVSARDPARAVAVGDSRAEWHYAGRQIVVAAHCVTSSDREQFGHTVQVEITMDGRPYHSRSWATSVPREGF